jgi:hypothetical protein
MQLPPAEPGAQPGQPVPGDEQDPLAPLQERFEHVVRGLDVGGTRRGARTEDVLVGEPDHARRLVPEAAGGQRLAFRTGRAQHHRQVPPGRHHGLQEDGAVPRTPGPQ